MQNSFLLFQQRRDKKKLNRENFKKMQKEKKRKKKKENSLATTRFLQIFERNSKFEKMFLNFDTSLYCDIVCKTLALF